MSERVTIISNAELAAIREFHGPLDVAGDARLTQLAEELRAVMLGLMTAVSDSPPLVAAVLDYSDAWSTTVRNMLPAHLRRPLTDGD